MRTARNVLTAGVIAIAMAGSAGMALANGPAVHTMAVQLPDGGTVQIQYTGNVAPKVFLEPSPLAAEFFEPTSPFVAMDRISAEMDRLSALMHHADLMAMPFPSLDPIVEGDLRSAAPGFAEYSLVSTVSENGDVCTRTTEVTGTGNGQRPKMISHKWGSCGSRAQAGKGESSSISHDRPVPRTVPINAWPNGSTPAAPLKYAVYQPGN